MQIMMGIDAAQQAEMEMMIRELEAENRYFSIYFVLPLMVVVKSPDICFISSYLINNKNQH